MKNTDVFAAAKFENPFECSEIAVATENPDVRGTTMLPDVPVGKPSQITVNGSWSTMMGDYPIAGGPKTDPIVGHQDIDFWSDVKSVGGGTRGLEDSIAGAKNPMKLNEIL